MNNPGTLDRRISFISHEEVENEYGLTELQELEILKCWARIEPARGKEYYEAQKIRTQNSYNSTFATRNREISLDVIGQGRHPVV